MKFPNLNIRGIFTPKIPPSEQILFTKHLSMMLKSGVSQIESLRIIQEQTKNKAFKKLLGRIIPRIEKGKFLSESLGEARKSFGELFISVLKLGESSGTLPENLDYLSEEIKKSKALRSRVKSAMVYPIIILVVTIIVITVLLVFVLPKILPIFDGLGVELPITTRILINTSDIFIQYWLFIILGIVGFMVLFKLFLRLPGIKYILNRFFLLVPILGTMIKNYNLANISRTLSLLLKSGINVVEAITSTSNSISNPVYKDALMDATENVREGKAMYIYLEKHGHLFSPTFIRMVQIGERTGNLTHNLGYLSDFYEEELDKTVKALPTIFEPLMLIILGLLVGFIALSIITPIYEITQQI